MRKALLIFLLVTAAISVKAQDEPKQLSPDLDMLSLFYKRYMIPYVDGSLPSALFSKQSQMRRAYCTARCLARYQQLIESATIDEDPFIKAPGADQQAIKTLEFTKNIKQPGRYTVTYDAGEKITIELALVKEKDGWKIDYIY